MSKPMSPKQVYIRAYACIRDYAREMPYSDAAAHICYMMAMFHHDQRIINAIKNAHVSYEASKANEFYGVPFSWVDDALWAMPYNIAESLRDKISEHRFSFFDVDTF